MLRALRAAALLGLFPVAATAADPAPPTKLPGTVFPATPELCAPLPMTPTVSADVCGSTCTTCKPSLRDRLGLGTRAMACNTGTCGTGGCERSCATRLKEWFCWKPSCGSGLPILQPQPYSAPLLAYFPNCYEQKLTCGPKLNIGPRSKCGTVGCATGCATPGCGPNGCAVPQPPVTRPTPIALPTMKPAEKPADKPGEKPADRSVERPKTLEVKQVEAIIPPIERTPKPKPVNIRPIDRAAKPYTNP